MKVGVILARFQPIHNGHLALIEKAVNENDKVLILIGSSDKLGFRNPIPIEYRKLFLLESIYFLHDKEKISISELKDFTDESDNSKEWGDYLYNSIVDIIEHPDFTLYYSDNYRIVTSWFSDELLYNHISLSLQARASIKNGISATRIRKMILNNEDISDLVPSYVNANKKLIKSFLEKYSAVIVPSTYL